MIRIFCILWIIVVAFSAQAGGWWDDFEAGNLRSGPINWTTGAPDSEYLSHEYNRTAAEGSSTSLKLVSDEATSSVGHGNAFYLNASGGNSAYFYDDGAENASFRVGLDMIYEGPENSYLFSFLGVGVSDNLSGATNQYIVHRDHTTVSTGITRVPGWHRLQMSWVQGKTPRLMLDTTLLTGDKNTTHAYGNSGIGPAFHSQTFNATTSSGTTATQLWLDDVVGNGFPVPVSFVETYENEFDPTYWAMYAAAFYGETTSALNHTAEPGSSRCLSIAPYLPSERVLALPNNRGYVTGWFYDDGTSGQQMLVAVRGAEPNSVFGEDTRTLGIGIRDGETSDSLGYLVLSSAPDAGPVLAQTGIPRSIGWHKFEFGSYSEGPGIKARLDGQEFPGNTLTDCGTVQRFQISAYMPFGDINEVGTETGYLYLDDLEYRFNEFLPELPAAVEDWRAFE